MKFSFNHVDPVDALKSLVKNHFAEDYFIRNANKIYNEKGERLYTTPETGNWWIDVEVR